MPHSGVTPGLAAGPFRAISAVRRGGLIISMRTCYELRHPVPPRDVPGDRGRVQGRAGAQPEVSRQAARAGGHLEHGLRRPAAAPHGAGVRGRHEEPGPARAAQVLAGRRLRAVQAAGEGAAGPAVALGLVGGAGRGAQAPRAGKGHGARLSGREPRRGAPGSASRAPRRAGAGCCGKPAPGAAPRLAGTGAGRRPDARFHGQ